MPWVQSTAGNIFLMYQWMEIIREIRIYKMRELRYILRISYGYLTEYLTEYLTDILRISHGYLTEYLTDISRISHGISKRDTGF